VHDRAFTSSCWLSSLQSRQHRPPAETPEAPNGMASMPVSHRVRCPSHTRCPRLSPGLCPLTILIIPLGSHHRTACLIKPAPVPRILRLDSHCDARIRTSPLPRHCLNPGIVLLPQLLRNQLTYNSWRPVLKRLVCEVEGLIHPCQ